MNVCIKFNIENNKSNKIDNNNNFSSEQNDVKLRFFLSPSTNERKCRIDAVQYILILIVQWMHSFSYNTTSRYCAHALLQMTMQILYSFVI